MKALLTGLQAVSKTTAMRRGIHDIPLAAAVDLLPAKRNGKKFHPKTIRRWVAEAKLEAWRVGRDWFTSEAALERYLATCNPTGTIRPRTMAQASEARRAARQQLTQSGFYGRQKTKASRETGGTLQGKQAGRRARGRGGSL